MIIIIIIMSLSPVTDLFSPVPLLSNCDPHSSGLKCQPAACIMCDGPCTVVFVVYLLSVVSVWL